MSEDCFGTLGLPLKSGRGFAPTDRADTPDVAIVNESFAKKLFPNGDALGQMILRGGSADVPHEIVGIVGDAKSQGLHVPAPDTLYLSLRQIPQQFVNIVAKVDGNAAALQGILRSAVAATDRSIAIAVFRRSRPA